MPTCERSRTDALQCRPDVGPDLVDGTIAVDFEEHAVLVAAALGDGAHLVGHSYGGVISLLAAAAAPGRVRSLTVIEPPALGVARGNPAADAFLTRPYRAPFIVPEQV